MSAYKSKDILSQLDRYAGNEDYQFPYLDDPMSYMIGARLSAYRDGQCWSILFERVGYNPRATGHAVLTLAPFGNCLKQRPVPHQVDFMTVTKDVGDVPAFVREQGLTVLSSSAVAIYARDVSEVSYDDGVTFSLATNDAGRQMLPVEHRLSIYERNRIPLANPPHIEPHDLFRLLYPRFRELFHGDEAWLRPHVMDGEMPSHSPSLIAISQMLESGDIFDFADPGVGNTHWSHWPGGGSL
jgi:hypothetical protein